MRVEISPMPLGYKKIPARLRPGTPPVFPDGPPTDADRALARDLFRELDPGSQGWYRTNCPKLFEGL